MQVGTDVWCRYSTGYECLQEVSAEIRVVPRNFRSRPFVGRGLFFVSNEPGSHACMDIWRLPRKSDAPLFAAGYLIVFHIYHQTSKKKKVGESNAGKKCINRPSV